MPKLSVLNMDECEDDNEFASGICSGAYAVYSDSGELLFIVHDMREGKGQDIRDLYDIASLLPIRK